MERSEVAASIQVLLTSFCPTPSPIQGDYFLASLKGPFHTMTRREGSEGVWYASSRVTMQTPRLAKALYSHAQRAWRRAPDRKASLSPRHWEKLWGQLTQIVYISFPYLLHLGSVEEGAWQRRTEAWEPSPSSPPVPLQQTGLLRCTIRTEDVSRLGRSPKSTGFWNTDCPVPPPC